MRCRLLLQQAAGLLPILVLVVLATGCADENAEGRYVLSGSVTYDGQPVNEGTIEFFPAEGNTGKPAGAEIVDGHYEMERTLGPELGAYNVVILAKRPSGRMVPADEGSSEMIEVPEQYIPEIYNTRTTLTTEVTGDQEGVDFALEKAPGSTRRR